MSNIESLNQTTYTQAAASSTKKKDSKSQKSTESSTDQAAAYEKTKKITTEASKKTYTVDMDKIRAMKEESDTRLLELFKDTAKKTGLKQLGGIRGVLDKIKNGEDVKLEIPYTAADVEQAKKDVAEGGYWSAGKTSDRLVDFAKALSGGDPAKAKELKQNFIDAFKEIEDKFGGALPDISYDTYDQTVNKFDKWIKGEDND